MWSVVFILPLVCSLHFTHSLYLTLNLHFIPGLQSAACSPQSAFYTDRFVGAISRLITLRAV